ncbi:hypothetical protein ACU635_53415 [[Actinomadura] parvosata]|uniref:hypothetical protein n=1 Tax=[Actinomadura] parvosata TaxID=1955412 RepID=UPI00406CB2DE
MNENLIAEARKLVEDIAAQSARERELFETAYRLGFISGEEVGYQRALHEMAASWGRLAEHVRGMANSPARVELERLRSQPGKTWADAATRRGGDYKGGPVEWERGAA